MYNYTNLTFTELVDKIANSRFWDLPKMVAEALKKLLSRVEVLEDAPAPTGDFIPLSGTTVGKPVTGDIEIQSGYADTNIYKNHEDEDWKGRLIFSDSALQLISENFDNTLATSLNIYKDKVQIGSNDPISKGLEGVQDFTSNITDLDYVQKKYVDERGSILNITTSALSASDLNTAYPNAKDGFSVIAPNVVGGGKYYIKAGAGWVYQQILAVV